MPDLYDMSLITAQDSFISQVLVINWWTNGVLFSGMIIAFALIMFIGSKFADQNTIVSLIYASFFGSLTSIIMWLFQYNGVSSIPTLIPVLFIFTLGIAVMVRQLKGTLNQTD